MSGLNHSMERVLVFFSPLLSIVLTLTKSRSSLEKKKKPAALAPQTAFFDICHVFSCHSPLLQSYASLIAPLISSVFPQKGDGEQLISSLNFVTELPAACIDARSVAEPLVFHEN